MTTFPFLPSNTSLFQFQPTLDGNLYSASVPWNVAGQRYYIALFALDGTRVLTLPLVGSDNADPIESLSWHNGFVDAVTVRPHGYIVGKTIDLTILGCAPVAYNGRVRGWVTGRSSFQYPLAVDPGPAVQFGLADYVVDLTAGYFKDSRLVFRSSNATFEVSP